MKKLTLELTLEQAEALTRQLDLALRILRKTGAYNMTV